MNKLKRPKRCKIKDCNRIIGTREGTNKYGLCYAHYQQSKNMERYWGEKN